MKICGPGLVHRCWLSVAICVSTGLIAGCGSSTSKPSGSVSGRVTFQGQPVTSGVVNLMSKTLGAGASAPLGEDGKYRLNDPLEVGDYKVMITPPPPAPPRPEDGPPKPRPTASDIPNKYRTEATTDLTATVKAGSNTFDFDMKP